MRKLVFSGLIFFINNLQAAADIKVVCRAQEYFLVPGCESKFSQQDFEAKFEPGQNYAMAATTGQLNRDYEFRIFVSSSLKVMTASVTDSQALPSRTSKAHRKYFGTDDYIIVESSYLKSHSPGDCNTETFEMLCMIVESRADTDAISKKLTRILSR